jgi:hypothetical protein
VATSLPAQVVKGIPVEHAPFDTEDAVRTRIGHQAQRGGTRNLAWTGPGLGGDLADHA